MSTIKQVRKTAAELIQAAIDARVAQIQKLPAYAALKRELEHFQETGGDKSENLGFDESGDLVARKGIHLDAELTADESGEYDRDIARAVLESCTEFVYYSHEYKTDWVAEVSLGDAVIFEPHPDRNSYAIYSSGLNLKVNARDLIDEEHGFLIIETAMRKAGYFPSVVRPDGHGGARYVDFGKGNLSNAQIAAMLQDKIDSQNEGD